ncbi:hypothetical protein QR680_011689 [Steinernema hermaphroditum]|uniref:Uncharacterized protein n=1 Tax=Steinernema hermaphroditum TaxID=289476 RepID=A0AA39LYI2_9BILA|nr:hypothetical protein QR680_011689 [Steinernema hermaphroditum]
MKALCVLLLVFLGTYLAKSTEYRPCDVSLFKDNYIVLLTNHGIVRVDGHKASLGELNAEIDRWVNQSAHIAGAYPDEMVKPKLLALGSYSYVVLAYTSKMPLNSYNREELNIEAIEKGSLKNGFNPNGQRHLTSISRAYRVYDGLQTVVKSDEILTDLMHRSKLVTTGMVTGGYFTRLEEVNPGSSAKEKCDLCVKRPVEMIGDFFDRADCLQKDANGLYQEPSKRNAKPETFFFNQLESGKFKLQVEVIEEGHPGSTHTDIYYHHILTRLDPVNFFVEKEKCLLRKVHASRAYHTPGVNLHSIPQTNELPRLMIFPKKSGAEGVNFPELKFWAFTPTKTAVSTTTSKPNRPTEASSASSVQVATIMALLSAIICHF